MLTTTLEDMLMALVACCLNNDSIDNKLSDLKQDLFILPKMLYCSKS